MWVILFRNIQLDYLSALSQNKHLNTAIMCLKRILFGLTFLPGSNGTPLNLSSVLSLLSTVRGSLHQPSKTTPHLKALPRNIALIWSDSIVSALVENLFGRSDIV